MNASASELLACPGSRSTLPHPRLNKVALPQMSNVSTCPLHLHLLTMAKSNGTRALEMESWMRLPVVTGLFELTDN